MRSRAVAAASSSTAMRSRSINSDCVRSSSTSKRAATSASNGNWCSSRVQNAWMVCTFSPPGVSSACANSRRARVRRASHPAGGPRSWQSSASSSSSLSGVHSRERLEHTVRHVGGGGLRVGEAEDLLGRGAAQQQPDHALRQHMRLARARIGGDPGGRRRVGRGALNVEDVGGNTHSRTSSSSPPARPLVDARQMIVVAVARLPHRADQRAIRGRSHRRSARRCHFSRASALSACSSGVPSLNAIGFSSPAGSRPRTDT